MAEKGQEEFLVPKNLTEAKELVNKLSIEDLRTFCFTFALGQDGSKASLKERLLEYYRGQFTSVNGTPVPTPRKKSAVKSPPSNVKESLASETVHGMDQKSDQPFSSIIDQLRKSDRRIDEIEFAVNKMGAYVEEPLTDFRESLTEAIKDSREKMMRCFDKPSQPSDDTGTEQVPLFCGSKFNIAKRRLKFLEKNAIGVSDELEKLINAEAAPSRIERQLKKLNGYESDCVHSLEEALENVKEEKLTDDLLKEWDEFHSQILRISGIPEDFIAKNGVNTSSSEITEHVAGVKLPLLQLPKFSGNVLEWPAFHDAFVASVDSHKKLSNVQKFTHLRSCLSGRALKCIEGYSVTNDNYSKAFQDLQNRFGRKRLLANELVKSILNLDIPEKADGKLLRELHDTSRNRMRSLESLGLKPDDNPSLSMVLLPIFETKLLRELKEKWELELTKYETEEEDKDSNIKKFFQFLEGHVLSKEAPDDVKDGLPKHSTRNGRGKRFKNPDDEEKMSAHR